MKKSMMVGLALATSLAFSSQAQAGGVINGISGMVHKAGEAISGAVKRVAGPAMHAVKGLQGFMTNSLHRVLEVGKNLGGRVQDALRHFTHGIAGGIPALVKKYLGQGLKVGQGLLAKLRGGVLNLVNTAKAAVLKKAKGILGFKLPDFGGIAQRLVKTFQNGFGVARKIASGAIGRVTGQFGAILNGFRTKLSSAAHSFRKLLPAKK